MSGPDRTFANRLAKMLRTAFARACAASGTYPALVLHTQRVGSTPAAGILEGFVGKNENTLNTNDAVCTPPEIFEPILAALGPIGFDPCSHPASNVPAATQVLLPRYWTDPDKPPPSEEQNGETLVLWGSGLDFHWGGMGLVFVNPPYSELSKKPWIAKARDEADEAVLFLPVRTAGAWWQDEITRCQAITFLRGRITHDGETVGAPFHQCLVYCGPRVEQWLPHAVKLGWTVLGMPWARGGA